MGFGDVTLMAMIGAFLGWQAAVLTFFLAPFFGLAHAALEARDVPGQAAERPPIFERRPRNPFRAVPEHGGRRAAPVVALALARVGKAPLRTAPHAILV